MSPAADGDVGPHDELPEPTPAARALFGERLGLARRYGDLLAGVGIAHGHIGPREVPRLWDRHLANCAVVTDLLEAGTDVIDVGSGAGLPGLPMAIRRPDLRLTLVEPMLRRSQFLQDTVDELGLQDQIRVVRGRAEDPVVRQALEPAAVVTARAVAPLDRLATWCLPLVAPGGRLLALKGSSAPAEAAGLRDAPGSLPVAGVDVVPLGAQYEMETTQVIVVERGQQSSRQRRRT